MGFRETKKRKKDVRDDEEYRTEQEQIDGKYEYAQRGLGH